MSSCDLCPNESDLPTVLMCSREDCTETKIICLRCLEEAFCKYVALVGRPAVRERASVLQRQLVYLEAETFHYGTPRPRM